MRGARHVLQRCCLACGPQRACSRDSLAFTSHNARSVAEDRSAERGASGLNRSLRGFGCCLGSGILKDHTLATAVAVRATGVATAAVAAGAAAVAAGAAAVAAGAAAVASDHSLTAALGSTVALVATMAKEAVATLAAVAALVATTMAAVLTTSVAATAVVAAALRNAAAAMAGNSGRLTAHEGDRHQAEKHGRSDSIETLHSESPEGQNFEQFERTCVPAAVTKTRLIRDGYRTAGGVLT